ncbi:MAG: anhydro-N-acetylmuramic acid kinase [Gammaproteobacteria bacterium]
MSALFIGLISGTSADGIDTALVEFSDEGPEATLVHARSYPYANELRAEIEAAVQAQQCPLAALARLDARIGDAFADAAAALLNSAGVEAAAVSAIGSHGQTLGHFPDESTPSTLQVGDPNRIAARTGIPVVADFRRADVASDGQGAPLAPLFHAALFSHPSETRAVLNLGGIANLTVLRGDGSVTGFDVGPANTLLDVWASRNGCGPYDAQGAYAASGRPITALLSRLRSDPYFTRLPPKSTGREYFSAAWLDGLLGDEGADPADVQATLADLTATLVADAVGREARDAACLLVCGGGAFNEHLMGRIASFTAPLPVESTAAHGVAPDFVEAMLFAWLARERIHARSPQGLTGVTGATHSAVLGGVWLPPRQF